MSIKFRRTKVLELYIVVLGAIHVVIVKRFCPTMLGLSRPPVLGRDSPLNFDPHETSISSSCEGGKGFT